MSNHIPHGFFECVDADTGEVVLVPVAAPVEIPAQSTSEWVDAYRRAEFVSNGLSDLNDLDSEFTRTAGINRAKWSWDNKQAIDQNDNDPGLILKRLFQANEAEKRQKCLDSRIVDWEVRAIHARGKEIDAYLDVADHCKFTYLPPSDTRLVSEITIGSQDVFVTNTIRGGRQQVGGGVRAEITEFSEKSRARCERHIRNVKDDSIKFFGTLTYPGTYSNDGIQIKRDLDNFLKRLSRMGVKDVIWFIEWQSRGAPHFHLYLAECPTGNIHTGIKVMAKAWNDIVAPGNPDHLKVALGLAGRGNKPIIEPVRNKHAPSYYAVKYCTKSDQKKVPDAYQNVGRFWGYRGDLKPVYSVYFARGVAACRSAIDIIYWWRKIKFNGTIDTDLTMYSATLRGCSVNELCQLMDHTGWCPDG